MDIRETLCKDKPSREYVTSLFDELRKEFEGNSDRGVTVISASIIDVLLEDLLKSFLVPINDKSTEKTIFSGNGPLSNVSNKIEMAFALGLLSRYDKKLLKSIISVRNKFAHQINGIDFNNEKIINTCKNLIIEDDILVPLDIENKKNNQVIINKPKINDYRGWFQVATYLAITIIPTRKCEFALKKLVTPRDITHRFDFSTLSITSTKYLIKEIVEVLENKEKYNLTDEKIKFFEDELERNKASLKIHETQYSDALNALIIED